MKNDNLINTETRTIQVNGKPLEIKIDTFVYEDFGTYPECDFDFGNEEDNKAYLARFESGELYMGRLEVIASAHGVIGADHLGACHLVSGDSESATDHAKDYGMIENAIADLINEIQIMAKTLQPYA